MQENNPKLHYSEALKECAFAHFIAIVDEDEYRIKELQASGDDISYIIDIGANLGAASFQFQEFYPNARILVCEPEPELMKYARLNTENKLEYIEEAIIGDDRKEVVFNVCKWAGNGHVDGNFRWDLFEPMGSMKIGEIKVKASTLKDIMDRYNFPYIDLLKIDTEGMEGQILQKFKPYMNLVKHFRGEWHGQTDCELMKSALEETHDIFIDKRYTTHGDFFAIRKDVEPVIEDKGVYKIARRAGLPDKITYE